MIVNNNGSAGLSKTGAVCCIEWVSDELLGKIFSFSRDQSEEFASISLVSRRFYRVLTSQHTPEFFMKLVQRVGALTPRQLHQIKEREMGKELIFKIDERVTSFLEKFTRRELDALFQTFKKVKQVKLLVLCDRDLQNLPVRL